MLIGIFKSNKSGSIPDIFLCGRKKGSLPVCHGPLPVQVTSNLNVSLSLDLPSCESKMIITPLCSLRVTQEIINAFKILHDLYIWDSLETACYYYEALTNTSTAVKTWPHLKKWWGLLKNQIGTLGPLLRCSHFTNFYQKCTLLLSFKLGLYS